MARIDPRLNAFAKEIRRAPGEWEKRLWRQLSASRLGGFKFRRQYVVEPYICDFFCPAIGLVVELDDAGHDPVADARRDAAIARQGFTVMRVSNQDVRENMAGVLEAILMTAQPLPDRWSARARLPHPNPSPEGEGL